jgi:hypothetical protein
VQRRAQALAGRVERGPPLPATPVEQDRRVAGADSQDLQRMMGGIGRQFHGGARVQREGTEESRYHVRIIANIWKQRMVSLSPPVCDFGRPAIDFDLPGVDGRRHTLASVRGPGACW